MGLIFSFQTGQRWLYWGFPHAFLELFYSTKIPERPVKAVFAPVKGFFEELLGLFYGKIEPFYFHEARGGSVLPVPAAATLLRRPRGTTA